MEGVAEFGFGSGGVVGVALSLDATAGEFRSIMERLFILLATAKEEWRD